MKTFEKSRIMNEKEFVNIIHKERGVAVMVKNVGKIIVSRQNSVLEYYIFGDERSGFGVRIVQRGTVNAQAEYANVCSTEARAMALARTLATGTVCPGHLCNILDDGGF